MTLADLSPHIAPALAGLAGVASGAAAYAYLAPTSRAFLPMVSRGDRAADAVAITFDDGPHPDGTGPVLDVLAEFRVPAAFFVIGANARAYPALIERMHAQGHLVCNHSFDHARFGALRSGSYWEDQLRRTDAAISEVIGRTPALFRPPWGQKGPAMRRPLQALGKTPVGWSRRALDGVPTTADSIIRRMAAAQAGDVLVLHDGREPRRARDPGPTIAALPRLLRQIKAAGLRFAPLDELIGRDPYSAAEATGAFATS